MLTDLMLVVAVLSSTELLHVPLLVQGFPWLSIPLQKGFGRLHHEGPHHFVVFVRQEMAVVHVSWEFQQFSLVSMEVVCSVNLRVIVSFRPTDSNVYCSMGLDQSYFLPPSVVAWDCFSDVIADVLMLLKTAVSIIVGIVIGTVPYFFFYVDS